MQISLSFRNIRFLVLAVWGLGLTSMTSAAERTLQLAAINEVRAGQPIQIQIRVGTDAGDGERIGFLHVEGSVDGGKTWEPLSYLSNLETIHHNVYNLKAGAVGSSVQIRARVAFRDGLAGDVDYAGQAILWEDTWAKWAEPPARLLTIPVGA